MTAAVPERTDDGVELITFGCRLNAYESEAIRKLAREGNLRDTVIVNTCTVTAEAERQARQAIRRARRLNPHARIVVTGCAAQVDPARFAAMAEVDLVLGNEEKLMAESFAGPFLARTALARAADGEEAKIRVNDIMAVRETAPHLVPGFEGRARAFVQVQQGCDHRCTFCIIPFGRGPSRSVALGDIVAQARELVANGYREIVLTGVDISSYGSDLPGRPTLGQMTRRLLALVPGIERLRLSSVDPAELDADLLQLLRDEERVMPHLHLSLQAGDDMILKRMKRRHSRSQAVELCGRLRELRPGLAIGADLIAGFPTETDAMFENTLALVADCGLAFLHVFPFSARKGTPAARMPAVAGATVRARAKRLREAGEAGHLEFLRGRVDTTARVLVERDGFGHCEHFAPVRLDRCAPGEIVAARIVGFSGTELLGEAA
ncbi:MAG: tRNA (N(6)-L-threonylcarbamoyladenosine(37)-C(2))-methylthiotransferase MtaB [Alphaproteobacteria bacterium]